MANYDIYQLSQDWKNVKGVFGEFKNKIDLKLSEIESFERNKGTIEQLTKDKENAYREGYEAGAAMAWSVAASLELLELGQLKEVFPDLNDNAFVCNQYSFEYVNDALDKWYKKRNSKIVVGDEVTTRFSTFVVTNFSDDKLYGMDAFGTFCTADRSLCEKTGRHFKELDELFHAMGKPAETVK